MWQRGEEMLRRSAQRVVDNTAEFLPGLLGLIVILLVSLLIAIVARWLVLRALRGIHFDQRAEYLGLGAVTDWSAIGGPSVLIARLVTWFILLAGLLAGLSALDAALPEQFARTIFAYIPDVLAALLILVAGAVLARFLARSLLIGAVNLQLPSAPLLSVGVKWLVTRARLGHGLRAPGDRPAHRDARLRHPLRRHRAGAPPRRRARLEGPGEGRARAADAPQGPDRQADPCLTPEPCHRGTTTRPIRP